MSCHLGVRGVFENIADLMIVLLFPIHFRRYNYNVLDEDNYNMPMQRLAQNRFDNAIEAEVQNGDTLQAIALRFRCSVLYCPRQYNLV